MIVMPYPNFTFRFLRRSYSSLYAALQFVLHLGQCLFLPCNSFDEAPRLSTTGLKFTTTPAV